MGQPRGVPHSHVAASHKECHGKCKQQQRRVVNAPHRSRKPSRSRSTRFDSDMQPMQYVARQKSAQTALHTQEHTIRSTNRQTDRQTATHIHVCICVCVCICIYICIHLHIWRGCEEWERERKRKRKRKERTEIERERKKRGAREITRERHTHKTIAHTLSKMYMHKHISLIYRNPRSTLITGSSTCEHTRTSPTTSTNSQMHM